MASKQEGSSTTGAVVGLISILLLTSFVTKNGQIRDIIDKLDNRDFNSNHSKVRFKKNIPESLGKLTISTRASTEDYEDLLGCGLQSDFDPDPYANDRATVAEKDCVQYAAYVIGKNSYGWDDDQQAALVTLWTNESQWSANADNPNSTAYGIPQAMTSDELHWSRHRAEIWGR